MHMKKVRVGIIGVGNCASSLIQGVHYYRNAPAEQFVPGLMHVDLGGYHVGDIEFSAAFDIDEGKVGRDLSEVIFAPPNNTVQFAQVPHLGVPVARGMTHDGIAQYLAGVVRKAPGETADIVQILRDTRTDVVVNYLPVGSEEATKWYVEQVLEAGCAFVNCIPVFIAREKYWQERFEKKGLPVIGDDIKSQVGATITHRVLANLFVDRGIRMEGTTFGDVPLNLEMKLEVWDSPNSAGIVIDAVRCAKLGLDHGLKGALVAPSAYFKKSPPVQIPDDRARELTEEFIRNPKA